MITFMDATEGGKQTRGPLALCEGAAGTMADFCHGRQGAL
jgi:hypothetical protein